MSESQVCSQVTDVQTTGARNTHSERHEELLPVRDLIMAVNICN